MTYSSLFVDRTDSASLIPDMEEVFRYMGYALKDRKNPDGAVGGVAKDVVEQFQDLIFPQAVYVCYPMRISDGTIFFGCNGSEHKIESRQLSKFLAGCTSIFIFAATLGPKVDREIQKAQRIEPSRSVVMQAAGAMFIEEYCDMLCRKFKLMAAEDDCVTRPRYSPGFGDVPLEYQKTVFKILDCRKIGLTLMDSLIMAPEKSVTAFVGVRPKNYGSEESGTVEIGEKHA